MAETSTNGNLHLTSGRLLARNTIWNLLGLMLPMAVSVVAIPLLIRGMGVPRFGILSLASIVVGYFSLFDLGIGRALTKLVADKLGANEEHSIPPLAWTSLYLMLLLGVFGGLVALAISPWLVYRILKIPETLQTETLRSFYLVAISIPIVTVTAGLRGILEAQQRFRILNLIRIPMSIFFSAGPLLVLPWSNNLVPVLGVLVVGRLLGGVAHLFACLHAMPALRHSFRLERSLVRLLLRFGGWMTVSNLVGTMMVYLDRFLIGALLTVTAVAYYTVPFDMVSRLTVIPVSVASVLFPAFALTRVQDPRRTGLLLSRGVKYIFLAIFPMILVIVTLAPEILRLWLGAAFSENGSIVLRWLAAGIFMNCLAYIPFALVQGIGRPDITAKLHLLELPIYLVGVWVLTKRFGIEGASIAWTARATLDALLLFIVSKRLLPKEVFFLKRLGSGATVAVSALYAATLPSGLVLKSASLVFALLGFVFVSWFFVLKPEERLLLARGRPALPVTDSGIAISASGRSDAV